MRRKLPHNITAIPTEEETRFKERVIEWREDFDHEQGMGFFWFGVLASVFVVAAAAANMHLTKLETWEAVLSADLPWFLILMAGYVARRLMIRCFAIPKWIANEFMAGVLVLPTILIVPLTFGSLLVVVYKLFER